MPSGWSISIPSAFSPKNDLLVINPDLQLRPLTENLFPHISWLENEQYGRFSSNGIICIQNGAAVIVLWFPEEKVLFGGCLIRSLAAKGMGNTGDAVLRAWGPTVAKYSKPSPI